MVVEHGLKLFSFFLPAGTPFALLLLVIPIEIVSYFIRVISLSVRLFANLMSGHILLKVLFDFSFLVLKGSFFYGLVCYCIPLCILFLLLVLEMGVAFVQAYVFTILICIYLNDALVLH